MAEDAFSQNTLSLSGSSAAAGQDVRRHHGLDRGVNAPWLDRQTAPVVCAALGVSETATWWSRLCLYR